MGHLYGLYRTDGNMSTGSIGPTGKCIQALGDLLGHVYKLCGTYWDIHASSVGPTETCIQAL
eukprot:2535042-Pyramimonas_sp.AAC.1